MSIFSGVLHSDVSDVSPFTDGNRSIKDASASDTIVISVPAESTESWGFISEPGLPGNPFWQDGGTWSTTIRLISGGPNMLARCRAIRINSVGTILQAGTFTDDQNLTNAGNYNYTIINPSWDNGEEDVDNRIAIEIEVSNSHFIQTQSITIGTNTIIEKVETNITTGLPSINNNVNLFTYNSVESSGILNLFTEGHNPLTNNLDLFIGHYESEPKCHYIDDMQTWHIITSGQWVIHDLSNYIPSIHESNIVAEILIANIAYNTAWSGGVRTPGSIIDRRFNIRQAEELGVNSSNCLTMHVQISGGKIECFAENYNDIEFNLVGYWIGPRYIEVDGESIRPASGTPWTQYDLAQNIPDNAIAEVIVSQQGTAGYRVGIREVGSSVERWVTFNGGTAPSGGEMSFGTTFVHVSGNNATIEASSDQPSDGFIGIHLIGYWFNPPGDYTELHIEDVANPTIDNIWEDVIVSGIPNNSIADFLFGHHRFNNQQWLGLRPTNSNLERKINTAKLNSFSTYGRAAIRMHVNVDAGSGVTVFADSATGPDDHFNCLGYWDNFTDNIKSITNNSNLFIEGHLDKSTSENLFIHGHDTIEGSGNLYIYGCIESSGTPAPSLFIYGYDIAQTSGNLYINSHEPSTMFGDLFIKGCCTICDDSNLFIGGLSTTNKNISLFINGHDTAGGGLLCNLYIEGFRRIEASGDLYLWGCEELTTSGNLFIGGLSSINTDFDLFIDGWFDVEISQCNLFVKGVRPPPVCPTLDPTASIQIKASLINIYQSRIDALINQLGKNVYLEFDPIREPCVNCEYDTIRKRSTGIYIPGGPRPFARGRRCPHCYGRGFEETVVNKCIKCLIKWNPRDAENFGISITQRKGIVRLKTYLTEADDLARAKTVIVNHDIVDQMKLKVRLIQGPIPVGLREDRYCISFWELL